MRPSVISGAAGPRVSNRKVERILKSSENRKRTPFLITSNTLLSHERSSSVPGPLPWIMLLFTDLGWKV